MTNNDARTILDRVQAEYGHDRLRLPTRHREGRDSSNPTSVKQLCADLGLAIMLPPTRPMRAV